LLDDRTLLIGQDYYGRVYPYVCDGEHRSIDLYYADYSHSTSTPYLAVAEGTCTVGEDDVNGKWVIVTCPIPPLPSVSSFTTRYNHCNQILVENGEYVFPGHQLGTMGMTGVTSGLHLHFQIRRGDTCQDTINPCDVMPEPANGIAAPYENCFVSPEPDPGTDVKRLICITVESELKRTNADPYFNDQYGNRLRKSTLAAAIGYGESRWHNDSQNCIPDEWYGGAWLSHVGIFQTQNPTQIPDDILAGIIDAASVITDDPECPGIEVAQDYKRVVNSTLSFLRQSSLVTYLTPWEVYTVPPSHPNCYLNHLDLSECPPETWEQP